MKNLKIYIENTMSNDPYQQRNLFCEEIKMKKPKIKLHTFPGICFGIAFPLDYYSDLSISILCFDINIKWRKR